MLGYVFIAKVYIDSNIEIEVKVIMYYFQSLKWERKTKKEYGLDFSFKYLQKRNIRKEKQEEHNHPHQLAIARWIGSIHHLRKPSTHTQSQSQSKTPSSGRSSMQTPFLRWLAIARPPQSFPNPKTRLLSGIIPH